MLAPALRNCCSNFISEKYNFTGIAIGLAPSAKYQTSYEPVYYTQTRKPAPVVKAVRAGIKLAGDVSSRIRTGIGQRVQALRNVLRVPPEKHIHHHPSSYSNSYSVDTYSPAPAYTRYTLLPFAKMSTKYFRDPPSPMRF